MVSFKATYQENLDSYLGDFGVAYIAGPLFIIALIVHLNLNGDTISDASWMFAIFLESVALIPQIYMSQIAGNGDVIPLTAHFIAAQGFGCLMEFLFWTHNYHELANSAASKMPGFLAMFSHIIQLLWMLNFLGHYHTAVMNALPIVLPRHEGIGMLL